MHIEHKDLILKAGNAIEVAGNITLAAAAIFGIMSSFFVLASIKEKSKPSHQGGGSTFNYMPINININSDSPLRRARRSSYDNYNFYRDLLVSSSICSIIGTALAINFQVYWVAVTVVSLWTAALALSWLGREMINYALNLKDDNLCKKVDALVEPSAPPLEELPHAEKVISVDAYPISEEDAAYYQPAVAHWLGY